jgi:hypothetical protein
MKSTNIAFFYMMSFLIVACGGGGSSSTSPAIEPVEVTVVVEDENTDEEPDPNAIYDTTSELIASKSFLIEQEYELAVNYKNHSSRNAYLSVCTEFTEGQNGIKVNYNSCLIRTSIDKNFAGTIKVANDNNRLVMAIWYFDDKDNPRYEVWENDSDKRKNKIFSVD